MEISSYFYITKIFDARIDGVSAAEKWNDFKYFYLFQSDELFEQ